jgi:hypothetical protein
MEIEIDFDLFYNNFVTENGDFDSSEVVFCYQHYSKNNLSLEDFGEKVDFIFGKNLKIKTSQDKEIFKYNFETYFVKILNLKVKNEEKTKAITGQGGIVMEAKEQKNIYVNAKNGDVIMGEKLAEKVELKDGKTKISFGATADIDGVTVEVAIKLSKGKILPLFMSDEIVTEKLKIALADVFNQLENTSLRYLKEM